MDYDTLCSELVDDPLGRDYASMTGAEVAASLNAADVTEPYPNRVTVRTLMSELGPTQTASVLQAIRAADDADGTIALALEMLTEYSQGGGFDIGHPYARAFVDGLVTAEVITAEQGAALKALAERQVSRAEQLGLSQLDEAHVQSARAML